LTSRDASRDHSVMNSMSKMSDQRLMLVRFPKTAHIDEGLLFWMCSQFGVVLRMSKFTKKNNGWQYWNAAIVLYQDKAACQRAIEHMHQRVWADEYTEVGILRCEHSINQDLKFSHNDHSNWDFSPVNDLLKQYEGRLNGAREALQMACRHVMRQCNSARCGLVLPYGVIWNRCVFGDQLEPRTPPQEVQHAVIMSGLPDEDVLSDRHLLVLNCMMGKAQRACRDPADPGAVRIRFETQAECEYIAERMARKPLTLFGKAVSVTTGRWSGSAGQKLKRQLPCGPEPPSSRLQLRDLAARPGGQPLGSHTTASEKLEVEKLIKSLFRTVPGPSGRALQVTVEVFPETQSAIVKCISTEEGVLAACSLNGFEDESLGTLEMFFMPEEDQTTEHPIAAGEQSDQDSSPGPAPLQRIHYVHAPYSVHGTEYFTSPMQSDLSSSPMPRMRTWPVSDSAGETGGSQMQGEAGSPAGAALQEDENRGGDCPIV